MGMTAEYIEGLQRDPHHVFSNRVRYVNYGNCWYFKPMTKKEFLRVDPFEACDFFSKCFRNPKEFTVVLVSQSVSQSDRQSSKCFRNPKEFTVVSQSVRQSDSQSDSQT
eukprot:7960507-Pyramimonas_sp.AAC.1